MKKRISTILILLLSAVQISAQQLYMPRSVKRAYAAGTRSMDGKPGARYFQNKSVHRIRLFVAPPNRRVTGSEEIVYQNNSPFPIMQLVFRFDFNAHAPEGMREKPVETSWLTSEMQIDEYVENGKVRPWKPVLDYKGLTANAIALERPIPPGGSATLSFRWHYDLSEKSEREGAIDPTTFYLAYFYPRVAVLDDVNLFDFVPHMLQHEFYSDFNDYTVEISVPKNFIVWGTGELTNIDEVLDPKHAERLKRSFASDEVVKVATLDELRARSVTAQTDIVTWKWKAENVPDVAFGVSDHYIWDAGSVVVDRKTGRRASAQAAYDEGAKNFPNMVNYIKTALDFTSNEYPGVPYPYPKMTVFRGFADMEYPMMANDSAQDDPKMQQFIAAHEILHTYFPFYMGINERRYGFMEEGWTTAFEYTFNTKIYGREYADELFKRFRVNGWITSTFEEADIPIITPDSAISGTVQAYGDNKYGRAALGYLALRDLLGEAEFKKSLHAFMTNWNGRHPIPWDMFNSFNSASGKDLNWFFKSWFFSNGYIDLGVRQVAPVRAGTEITLQNTGGYPAPVEVVVTYADNSTESFHQTPAIWQANPQEAKIVVPTKKPVASIALDGGIFMDANASDNQWKAK